MEIMPHIKALLDDISTITKSIVVKRSDLADANDTDNENIETYYEYKDIMNGIDSIDSLSTIPADIMNSLITWKKSSTTSSIADILPGIGSTESGGTTQYYDYRKPDAEDQLPKGTVWVHKLTEEYVKPIRVTMDVYKYILHFKLNGSYSSLPDDINTYKFYYNGEQVTVNYNTEFVLSDAYDNGYCDVAHTTCETANGSNVKYVIDDVLNGYRRYTESTDVDKDTYYNTYTLTLSYITPHIARSDIYVKLSDMIDASYAPIDSKFYKKVGDDYIEIPLKEVTDNSYRKCNQVTYMINMPISGLTASIGGTTYNCTLEYVVSQSNIGAYWYYTKDANGPYSKVGGSYVIADDESEDRYRKVVIKSLPSSRYVYFNGTYTLSATGDYIYECTYDAYVAAPYSDTNITSSVKISDINSDFKDACITIIKSKIKNMYCPDCNRGDFAVPRYTGEKNTYYRMINGLPDISNLANQPKVNRKIIGTSATNENVYAYELTDYEVSLIEKNGMLANFKRLYPNEKYLNYLGKNRVDVIRAREADAYDILLISDEDSENAYHVELFRKSYANAQKYVLNKYYQPEMFQDYTYYGAYIGFLILSYAAIQCITQSSDILTYDRYMDDETINNVLSCYGFDREFESIPSAYRKMIAKNILMLIKYRGTDDIYKIIYNICKVSDYNIFKYEIVNDDDAIRVIKKSVFGDKAIDEIDINELTADDNLWKAGADIIHSRLLNKAGTKYVDIDTCFDLSKMTLNSSYLLNYLFDSVNAKSIEIDVPGLGVHTLKALIVALFSIQASKFGYDGSIPSTPSGAIAIQKFNLAQSESGDETLKNILKTCKDKLIDKPKENIENLLNMLKKNPSVCYPSENQGSVRSIADSFNDTLMKDDKETTRNENSFYEEVLELRKTCNNITEYICYSDILDAIATSAITQANFDSATSYNNWLSNHDANLYTKITSDSDNAFNEIISKLESMINSNELREMLITSHTSEKMTVSYIELLISIFKSYSIDLRKSSISYMMGNEDDNGIHIMDELELQEGES